jgi:hypothetical protein
MKGQIEVFDRQAVALQKKRHGPNEIIGYLRRLWRIEADH